MTRQRARQCEKCPWRVDVDPTTIPGGYDAEMHRRLGLRTIAREGQLPGRDLHIMACHESKPGHEFACVGWLHNQLTDGNSIPVRIAVREGRLSADYELVGEQHACFEDTLPPPPSPCYRSEDGVEVHFFSCRYRLARCKLQPGGGDGST